MSGQSIAVGRSPPATSCLAACTAVLVTFIFHHHPNYHQSCIFPPALYQYLVRFRHPVVTNRLSPNRVPCNPPVLILPFPHLTLQYSFAADFRSSTARTAPDPSNRCLVVLPCCSSCCWCCCRETRCKEAFCDTCDYLHGSADRSLFDLGCKISYFSSLTLPCGQSSIISWHVCGNSSCTGDRKKVQTFVKAHVYVRQLRVCACRRSSPSSGIARSSTCGRPRCATETPPSAKSR